MEEQGNQVCAAFFFDMKSNAMVDMPHPQTELPESLAVKVNNKSLQTRDQLDALINKAHKNREKILQLKVQRAKAHDERVEQVKQLKKEMDENMTLLGNTIPCNQRSLPTSPTLPKRLMQRLQTLEKQSPPKTADMIRKRENRAQKNRNRILEEKREKARNSVKDIPRQSREPPVPPPYQASVLPTHLVQRLASLPAKRTTKQLLDSYSRASKNREGNLRLRQEKIREHLNHVEALRLQHNNKAKIKLPGRLTKRLERISFHHTPEEILSKEQRVHERKCQIVEARVLQAQAHLAHVKQVGILGKQRREHALKIADELHTLPVNTCATLPKHLKQKLEQYVAQRKTPKEIRDHESKVIVARQKLIQAKVQKAQQHGDKVEYLRMTKPNLVVPKLTSRLSKLLEERYAQHKKSPEQILLKHKNAHIRRDAMLQKRVCDVKQATDRSYHVARVAKEEKQRLMEEAKHAKLEKAAEYLPSHLKKRLLLFPQKTKFEIYDRLNFADVNREKFLRLRAKSCRKHLDLVEERKMLKWNRKIPKLTKNLQERLSSFNAKKKTAAELLNRERKAIERRQNLICKHVNTLKDRNESMREVLDRRGESQEQLLAVVHPVVGASFLPAHLKERLNSFKHVSKRDILDRESNAFVRRKAILENISSKASNHCKKVEMMRMCKMNRKQAKLPKRLENRLNELKRDSKSLHTMLDNAQANRTKLLKDRAEKAKVHNQLAKERSAARRRSLEKTATTTA